MIEIGEKVVLKIYKDVAGVVVEYNKKNNTFGVKWNNLGFGILHYEEKKLCLLDNSKYFGLGIFKKLFGVK